MRIATWNVNSLKARQEAVENWLERAAPDILLMQETKLTDADAPVMAFAMAGYQLVHHGEGRWNGVAIAARDGLAIDGRRDELRRRAGARFRSGRRRRGRPARTTSTRSTRPGWSRRPSTGCASSACTRRTAGSSARRSTPASSPGSSGSARWIARDAPTAGRGPRSLGGDFNVAPTDVDVWDARGRPRRHARVASPSGPPFRALLDLGPDRWLSAPSTTRPGRFTWWDYRAGMFHKNFGMRIDHLLASAPVAARIVDAEIDREARKGPPVPSDHAPLSIDLDEPGRPIDPDWAGALARIAARTTPVPSLAA